MRAFSTIFSALCPLTLALLPWPTLEQLNRYASPFRQLPEFFWVSVAVVLGIIAAVHAKDRQRREMARYSEELGWNFSKDWSPIGEEDWQQLSQDSNLVALSLAGNRKDFIWGTHLGTTFAMFDAPGGVTEGMERRTPETMIAFQKPPDMPAAMSIVAAGGISAWERFVTDRGFSSVPDHLGGWFEARR